MSWLDEMEAADPAYPGDVSYPAAGTRAGRGLYQLHAVLDDGHLDAGRDLIADWYARQANHVNEARPAVPAGTGGRSATPRQALGRSVSAPASPSRTSTSHRSIRQPPRRRAR